jgi:hypothetical protein
MSHHFHSLTDLAHHLAHQAIHDYKHGLEHGLHEIGEAVEEHARLKIGSYQPGIGPYPAWAPLTDATLERKTNEGFGKGGNPDTPLYASGEFEQDIGHTVDEHGLRVMVGTNKDYVIYSELGSAHEPPRPVLAPTALEVLPHYVERIRALASYGLGSASVGFAVLDADLSSEGQTVD